MNKLKVVLPFLMAALMLTKAYGQNDPDDHQVKSVAGTVTSTDSVGNIISIRTADQRKMEFFVPDKANIKQDTLNTGLMDIGVSDSVTIQYYVLPSAKNIVVSIVDNESVVNE